MSQQTKFVLFTAPRTGSTMMTSALSSVPNSVCLPAIFAHQGWSEVPGGKYASIRGRLSSKWNSLPERVADPDGLIRDICASADDCLFVGFKHHIVKEIDLNKHFLSDPSLRKVLLNRSNFLACYASNKIALLAREDGGASKDGPKIKCAFIADEFARYVKKREQLYAGFRQQADGLKASFYEIEYTEAKKPGGLTKAIQFLGFPEGTTYGVSTIKRSSDNIVSRFFNAENAEAYLERIGRQDWMQEA